MRNLLANERGFVLITCLSVLLMLGIVGAAAVMESADDVDISGAQLRDINALYAAEAGAELGYAHFRNAIDTTNYPPSPLPQGTFGMEGYTVNYSTVQTDTTRTVNMTQGVYRGLYGLGDDYDIIGTANSVSTPINNTVAVHMQKVLVPIFQFAVFYELDLEIHPGPAMTLEGRVHGNSNIYLGANSGLDIDSYVTCAEDILHGRKPGSGQSTGSGDVRIKDQDGSYQNMKNGDGSWLDHNHSDWVDESMNRWQGQVEDSDHGVNQLYLPVAVSGDPIDMIKDESGGNSDSFERKAGLKIIDGTAYYLQPDNSWSDVTAGMQADSIMLPGSFYDGREGKNVDAVDIDITKLNGSVYWPENGIIYTKQTATGGNLPATRLLNGSELQSGLTVASENAIYTVGDYNSVNKKPAAVICDAYNILSNNWDDSKSTQSIGNRAASNTIVNASFITGNTTTGAAGHNYNGGLENLPRFLESWSGKTLRYRGSMVDLWESEQATGKWSYGSYYRAPNRDWGFDYDLLDPNKLPPGTPMVNIVVKTGWAQLDSPPDSVQ